MKNISLAEFQNLIGVSDSVVLWLLKSNKLECQLASDGSIRINPESVTVTDLIQALSNRQSEVLIANSDLFTEKINRILAEGIEQVVDGALRDVEP